MNTGGFEHKHEFHALHVHGQRRSLQVLILTLAVMIIEIVAGMVFVSMALLADGWHMGTHAAAFVIVLAAYHYARKYANDPAFSFGTGKFSVLGGFASAAALGVVALTMIIESLARVIRPEIIRFNEALMIAVFGLAVNLASALILKPPHEHHRDHNLKAAYLHVLADALTSVLAIAALLCGKYFGWNRLDAFAGVVGGIVIAQWAFGLLRETAPVLLDASASRDMMQRIREKIETGGEARITDLHVWKIGPSAYAVILSLAARSAHRPDDFKARLSEIHHLDHISVEINSCADCGKID
jgi:cation diffusion facilitator family transporter